jgi:ADP-heptose:LPS heptosyltransferase
LILHPGALGDVLLAIPALRMLRAPADELVLAAQPRIGRLLASLAVVSRHVAFDTLGLDTLFGDDAPPERLRQLVAGARVVSWFASGDQSFTRRLAALAAETVAASTAPPTGTTVWQHLVASVGARAVAATEHACCDAMAVAPALVAEGRSALTDAGWDGARPLVMLHPGAGGVAKRWAIEGFAETAQALVDSFGVDLVVHEGPADHDAVVALRARLRVPARYLADPSLETLAGAVRHAALWIGNDSGVTHLAAAVGTPTLALFAPANLAWRPWARDARVQVVSPGALSRGDVDSAVAEAAAWLRARDPVRVR